LPASPGSREEATEVSARMLGGGDGERDAAQWVEGDSINDSSSRSSTDSGAWVCAAVRWVGSREQVDSKSLFREAWGYPL
jgi:hypothetical protein